MQASSCPPECHQLTMQYAVFAVIPVSPAHNEILKQTVGSLTPEATEAAPVTAPAFLPPSSLPSQTVTKTKHKALVTFHIGPIISLVRGNMMESATGD